MGSVRLALLGGGSAGAILVGACGVESGGLAPDDASTLPDVTMSADTQMLPDAPMDIQTPDLGTGETESGALCTCTSAVPMGWTIVSYTQKSRPTCPAAYGAPSNLVENPTANATSCACQCGSSPATHPTCGGTVTFGVQWGPDGSCGADGGGAMGGIMCAPGCTNGNWSFNPGNAGLDYLKVSASKPNPSGGACGSPTTNQKTIPQSSSDAGRACRLGIAPGNCMTGLCIPTPMAPDVICIHMPGVATCPGGFPNTHYVGDTVMDSRDCGPSACQCSLSAGSCSTPLLSLYDASGCAQGDIKITAQPADGMCRQVGVGDSKTMQSAKYTSTPSGASCAFAGTFNPMGMLGLSNVQTICCL